MNKTEADMDMGNRLAAARGKGVGKNDGKKRKGVV